MSIPYAVVVALVLTMANGLPPADEAEKNPDQAVRDLAALQGEWELNDQESLFFWTGWIDNDRFPNFEEFERSKTIEIRKDKLRFGDKLQYEITIILGSEAGRKTIRFQSEDKTPIVGIYELEKDVCRICAVDSDPGDSPKKVRLPEKCERTRRGWFARFDKSKL